MHTQQQPSPHNLPSIFYLSHLRRRIDTCQPTKNGKSATQQDCEAQQRIHHGDMTTAIQAHIDSLTNRIAAHMILFFHVRLRSALIYVSKMNYPGYTLNLVGNALRLQQCLAPQPNMFKAAYAGLGTRRVKIQFDDRRTIEVSCALVEAARPAAAPAAPLRLLRYQLGLPYAAKCNTNALFQMLFRVKVVGHLLQAEGERAISALNDLNDLDAVRDTAEMQVKQKLLFSPFADCEDNAVSRMVLSCTDSVDKAMENARNESEVSSNRASVTCGTVTTLTVTTTNQFIYVRAVPDAVEDRGQGNDGQDNTGPVPPPIQEPEEPEAHAPHPAHRIVRAPAPLTAQVHALVSVRKIRTSVGCQMMSCRPRSYSLEEIPRAVHGATGRGAGHR
ncbi:hypothetical protein FN846DRAFT_914214 [Sphaerosporella brunnea]|uniref:Uncharacterized protein n=1 Tax=Sphaerosporella brunnea TaxID=1250544 RepID=A0A5J5EEA4_9PEZI|nr:hypothetical protein FN846DRAFT_914214 [Sphaerosporella brunnea]